MTRPRLLTTSDRAAWAVPVTAGANITTALQETLDAAAAAGGGEVYIPTGHYYIDTNCGLTSATGVHVRGDGMGATIIEDSRAYGDVVPNGNYYGTLSFVSCSDCSVADMTLVGPLDPAELGGAFGGGGGSRAVFFRSSPRCLVQRIGATLFTDEAIFADGDCPGWHVTGCSVYETQTNGINLNSSSSQSEGASITDNWVTNVYFSSACNACGKSIVVAGNRFRCDTDPISGADLVVLDVSGRVSFCGNVLYDSNVSAAGASALHVFGTSTATASLVIANNVFSNITGAFASHWSADAAVVRVADHSGSVSIHGNTFNRCGYSDSWDYRAIMIDGASTGHAYVAGNVVRQNGYNMTIGVEVDSTVPEGAVRIGENDFSECSFPYVMGSAAKFLDAGTLAPGSYALGADEWHIQYKRLQLTGSQRRTYAGTARQIITDL